MYPDGPLFGPAAAGTGPLVERFALFDGGGAYDERVCKQRLSRKGGPRKRLFSRRGIAFDPEMTKYPLFHIRAGEVFDNPHHLHPYAENFVSPCHLGVLHYKFNDAFGRKIAAAVSEATYFNGSAEYRCYLQAIRARDPLDFTHSGSRRYRGPDDLVADGLLEALPWPDRQPPADARRAAGLLERMCRALRLRTSPQGTSARDPRAAAARCSAG
jgi:hypothetical protein